MTAQRGSTIEQRPRGTRHGWVFPLLLLPLMVSADLAAQPSHPMLANTCAGCHGTNGYSARPMPIIAGLSQKYLSKTLLEYKQGRRPSTIMGRLARGFSDESLNALASFFASQPWISSHQEPDPELIKQGRAIHAEQCAECHKDNGRYQDDSTPRLAGQWQKYLEIVLDEYWRKDRKMPNKFMTIVASRLRSDERRALASFYASQR